jgi:signal transduction histidine kinase
MAVSRAPWDSGDSPRIVGDGPEGVGGTLEVALGPRPGHLGLVAMRERAELSGGRLSIERGPGEGTLVQLHLPAD